MGELEPFFMYLPQASGLKIIYLFIRQHHRGFKYPSSIVHADTARAPATHTVLWYSGANSVGAPGTLHTQDSQWGWIY